MAWSVADLAGAELTNFTADRTLIGANVIPTAPTFAAWNTTGTVAAGTGGNNATYPPRRAYDGKTHLDTRTGSATAEWFFVFQFPSPGISFDFIGVLGSNWGTIGGDLSVKAQVGDSDFGSNVQTIKILTSQDARQLVTALDDGGGAAQCRFSGVEYFRLWLTRTGTFTPQIGELILGRRRQLIARALRPYDPDGTMASVDDFVSDSGVISRYAKSFGARKIEATLAAHTSAASADLVAWYDQIDHGSRPFVWCELPSSAPNSFHLAVLDEPALSMPYLGPYEREVQIVATEQGPDYLAVE